MNPGFVREPELNGESGRSNLLPPEGDSSSEGKYPKTWFVMIDIQVSDQAARGSPRYEIDPCTAVPLLLLQGTLGICFTWLSTLFYSQCVVAGGYLLAAGLVWVAAAGLSALSWIRVSNFQGGEEFSSKTASGITLFLFAMGSAAQLFAAALTTDCTGLLFEILYYEPVLVSGQMCSSDEAMVRVLGVPAAMSIAGGCLYVGFIIMLIRQELLLRGFQGVCTSPRFVHRMVPPEEAKAVTANRWRLLYLTLWLGGVAALAYGLWFSVGIAGGGGDSPVTPWECPARPKTNCDANVAKETVPLTFGASCNEENNWCRKYKMALWHEGYPIAYDGATDTAQFAAYTSEMVSFAKGWKVRRAYLQIYNPVNNDDPTKPRTIYKPDIVAANWLDKLDEAGIEAGFQAYINKKDSGWNRADPLSAVVDYIAQVEAASERNASIVGLSFDKEDLGDTSGDQLSDIVKAMQATPKGTPGHMSKALNVGYAGAASLFSQVGQPYVKNLFPELYWYGELSPHHQTANPPSFDCNQDCVTAMPCFSKPCVTSPYRTSMNNPSDMVATITQKLAAVSLSKHVFANARDSNREIYGLLSLEHLSGCCPERVYGPKDECGTFDGFALWDRDKFLDMLEAFAESYGFTQEHPMPIGLYEWQFVPPHWRDPALSASPVTALATSGATPTKCFNK